MVIPNTQQLATHARQLAAAFKIQLVETSAAKPEDGVAIMAPGGKLRAVVISPIIDDTTYAVALHEMGHLESALGLARLGAGKISKHIQLTEEQAAWEWAQHYALDWTPAMESVKAYALSTYEAQADFSQPLPSRRQPAPAPAPQPTPAPKPVITTESIDWSKWR